MRQGTFTYLLVLGLDFISWICIKNFQTFLEVKIDINRVNLTPCQAHWVLSNLLLGCAKDEHFSCFLSSCQLWLIRSYNFLLCKDEGFLRRPLKFKEILVFTLIKYLPTSKLRRRVLKILWTSQNIWTLTKKVPCHTINSMRAHNG